MFGFGGGTPPFIGDLFPAVWALVWALPGLGGDINIGENKKEDGSTAAHKPSAMSPHVPSAV